MTNRNTAIFKGDPLNQLADEITLLKLKLAQRELAIKAFVDFLTEKTLNSYCGISSEYRARLYAQLAIKNSNEFQALKQLVEE